MSMQYKIPERLWRTWMELGDIGLVPMDWKFQISDYVTKVKGSHWSGRVVGFYSTALTPRGYAVESDCHPGSVQIYPEAALERV